MKKGLKNAFVLVAGTMLLSSCLKHHIVIQYKDKTGTHIALGAAGVERKDVDKNKNKKGVEYVCFETDERFPSKENSKGKTCFKVKTSKICNLKTSNQTSSSKIKRKLKSLSK